MKYDLYDFDKTVYPYDSETVFLFHCLFRKPWLLILSPWLLLNLILFFLGFGDKFKGRCFTFLRFIDGEKEAKKFWEKQEKKIYPFFRPENRERPTVVCSASPEFLLRPICEKYGVDTMIATRMDPRTGTIIGRNCKDKQKPLRIAEALPNAEFVNVKCFCVPFLLGKRSKGKTFGHCVYGFSVNILYGIYNVQRICAVILILYRVIYV